MLYISTQVSRKRLRKIRPMEWSRKLPQPAPMQPGILPTLSWTDADSLTLEQICKELEMSETELDFCMPPSPAQVQADATTQSRRMAKEEADQINDESRQTDHRTNKRSKVAKWAVSETASSRLVGTKPKRSCKSTDVLDGDRRDVDERTRRDLDESDNE